MAVPSTEQERVDERAASLLRAAHAVGTPCRDGHADASAWDAFGGRRLLEEEQSWVVGGRNATKRGPRERGQGRESTA